MVKIIGIIGRSKSGKTSICNSLKSQFQKKIFVLHLDNYYKFDSTITNYDEPNAMNYELFITDVHFILNSIQLECDNIILLRQYPLDPPRIVYTYTLIPKETQLLILEGTLLFANPVIFGMCDYTIFIHTTEKKCLQSRKCTHNGAGDVDDPLVLKNYRAGYLRYIKPHKYLCDTIIQGGNNNVYNAISELKNKLQLFLN